VLDEAVVGQPFIKAGRKAMSVRSDDFITERLLPNGSRVRSELIPGFEKALAKFNEVKVPHGQATVARKVRKALEATIDDAEQLADNLDLGYGGEIDPRKEYASAAAALIAYDQSLRSRLKAAVDSVTGDVSGDLVET